MGLHLPTLLVYYYPHPTLLAAELSQVQRSEVGTIIIHFSFTGRLRLGEGALTKVA